MWCMITEVIQTTYLKFVSKSAVKNASYFRLAHTSSCEWVSVCDEHPLAELYGSMSVSVSWNSFWVKTNWCSCRRGWGQIMTTSARSTQAWTGRHNRPTPLHHHMDRRDKDNKLRKKRPSSVILLLYNPSTRRKQVQSPVRCSPFLM